MQIVVATMLSVVTTICIGSNPYPSNMEDVLKFPQWNFLDRAVFQTLI